MYENSIVKTQSISGHCQSDQKLLPLLKYVQKLLQIFCGHIDHLKWFCHIVLHQN